MTVTSALYYWVTCDYPGCESASNEWGEHGSGQLSETPEDVAAQFKRWEGGFADDFGWIEFEGGHYCCDHIEQDDMGDNRRPLWYCARCADDCTRHRPATSSSSVPDRSES